MLRRERDRDYIPMRILVRGILNRTPRCTRCRSGRVIPSRQPVPLRARLLGLTPYRCRECAMKFALHLPAPVFHDRYPDLTAADPEDAGTS